MGLLTLTPALSLGERGGKVEAVCFSEDRSGDGILVFEQIVVRESDDAEALTFQKRCSLLVLFPLAGVGYAIELDDQLFLRAAIVGEVAADGVLAAEL